VTGCSWYRADMLVGFRYAEIKDNLAIASVSRTTPASPLTTLNFNGQTFAAPFSLSIGDSFHTRNEFYGGQIGADITAYRGNLFANFRAKLALGDFHQNANIIGRSVLTPTGGTPTSAAGGLLALSSNSGNFSNDEFGIVPEIGLNVGYQFGR